MEKKKGRPKGEHKTMISARLKDATLKKMKENIIKYGYKQSTFIDIAINEYCNHLEIYKQLELEELEEEETV